MVNSIIDRLKRNDFVSAIRSIYIRYFGVCRKKFGYIHPTSFYRQPILIKGIENVYLYENTHLMGDTLIMSTIAKVIVKKNSGAAEGLTIITGNHLSKVGSYFMEISDEEKNPEMDKDVIIEEDVWIAANVTILSGVIVGRGSTIGAGAVCRNNVPPYAIVAGNPAKIVGFKFSPEEVIEHEKKLYIESERLAYDYLQKNYNKYFINKISDIKSFLKN